MTKRPSLISDLKLAEVVPEPAAPAAEPSAPARKPRPDIVHTSVYLPKEAHKRLREIAFTTDQKIHDIIMEGLDLALTKYGHPPVASLRGRK